MYAQCQARKIIECYKAGIYITRTIPSMSQYGVLRQAIKTRESNIVPTMLIL
jgi:hypothetical protein